MRKKLIPLTIVQCLLLATLATGQTDTPEPAKPPGEKKGEAKKDGGLAEEAARRLQFDAQLRFRYEYAGPFSYALPTPGSSLAGTDISDDAVFERIRLGLAFRFHRMVGARIQIQDSRIWGEEGAANTTDNPSLSTTSSTDNVDLHQAYVDINQLFERGVGEEVITLRLGRQELDFGDGRLVSPLDWSNVGRVWDAARLIWTPRATLKGLRLDLFGSILRDTASDATGRPVFTPQNHKVDEKQLFSGIYATYPFQPFPDWKYAAPGDSNQSPVIRRHSIDAYVFHRHLADRNIFFNEAGNEGVVNEVTAGALLKGGIAGFDYGAEGAYQGGRSSGDDIRAFGVALTGGYNLPPALRAGLRSARLGLEYDYGSGDSDPTDGVHETFDPLFPQGHRYQGFEDIFSWKNGQDLVLKAMVELPRLGDINPIWLEAQYHFFWLSDGHDAWFNAALNQIRRDSTGGSGNFVGTELDLHAKYTLVDFAEPQSAAGPQRLWLWVGYSRFFAEDFVENTGPSPDRDFAYVQIQLDL